MVKATLVDVVAIRMSHLGRIAVSSLDGGRHVVGVPRGPGWIWARTGGVERNARLPEDQHVACRIDVDSALRTCVCTTSAVAVYGPDLSLLWSFAALSPKAAFWNGSVLVATVDSLIMLDPATGSVLSRRDLPGAVFEPLMWLQRTHDGPAVLFDGYQEELLSHVFLRASDVANERSAPITVKGILHDIDCARGRCLIEVEDGALELRGWPDLDHLVGAASPVPGLDEWDVAFVDGKICLIIPESRILCVDPENGSGVLRIDFSASVDLGAGAGGCRIDWVERLNANYFALSRDDTVPRVEIWEISP